MICYQDERVVTPTTKSREELEALIKELEEKEFGNSKRQSKKPNPGEILVYDVKSHKDVPVKR